MATKPSALPVWDSNNVNVNEPPVGTGKANGWTPGTRPPAQWMNWWQRLVWTWVVWLDAFETDPHTWVGTQTFGTIDTQNAYLHDEVIFYGTASVSTETSFGHAQVMTTNDVAPRTNDALNDIALIDKWNAGGEIHRIYRNDDFEALQHTVNAKWNGTQWVKDGGTFSRRTSHSSSGAETYTHDGASPFSNAAWGNAVTRIGDNDYGESVRTRVLQLDVAGAMNQSTDNGAQFANQLLRAFARIDYNMGTVTLVSGINIDAATFPTSSSVNLQLSSPVPIATRLVKAERYRCAVGFCSADFGSGDDSNVVVVVLANDLSPINMNTSIGSICIWVWGPM